MADKHLVMTTLKSREIESTIYTDWANHHLEKTGVKRLIQDLPKDISDGVLLADIVHFVCGQPVERIHSLPRTTKQKLHNIERCLKVLQEHRVVLNDVNVQGLYRRELKCVLALFFHLSRYKQKEQDFKMNDPAKSGQRRCLRQPTTVGAGRKSRSFNANDRNRINIDVSGSDANANTASVNGGVQSGGIPAAKTIPSATKSTTGWRSKSMSAKHSATTKLLAPKPLTSTMQTFKPDSNSASNRSSMTSQGSDSLMTSSLVQKDTKKQAGSASRIGSPSRLQRSMRKPTTTDSLNGGVEMKGKTNGVGNKSLQLSDKANKLSFTKPVKRTIPGSKATSPVQSQNFVSKSLPSTKHSENVVSKVSESKIARTGNKPTSMMSRLKKLGSPTSNAPTGAAAKPRPTSFSKTAVESVNSSSAPSSLTSRKRAESCPPSSRLGNVRSGHLAKPQTTTATNRAEDTLVKRKSPSEKPALKSPSGLKSVKSTLGKAFGASKQGEKKKSPTSPSKTGTLSKTSKKSGGILKSEIHPIIPMVTNANETVQPIQSHTNGTYEVSDKLANVVYTDLPTAVDDVKLASQPSSADPVNDAVTYSERAVEPVSIASPRTVNRAHKTATVAPFIRQIPPNPLSAPESSHDKTTFQRAPSSLSLKRESPELKTDDDSSISASTPAEAREVAVKGIADLRLNLEETMCSLRNTQLRHRKGDAFQRRISAQLDEVEFDDTTLSGSSAIYRSHHNLLSCRTGARIPLSGGSNSPKLHAGETLGQHADYKIAPGRFSSLQRTKSARYPHTTWREITTGYASEGGALTPDVEQKRYVSDGVMLSDHKLPPEEAWDKDGSDDAGSISSGEISDYIGELSTDENSSTNNSPYHQAKNHPPDADRQGLRSKKLETSASNSAVVTDGLVKSLKLPRKKAINKPPSDQHNSGSSVVGSRLACNADEFSPSGSPLHRHVFNQAANRITYSYRSLPRPNKSKMHEDKHLVSSPLANNPQQNATSMKGTNTFKRSPSLQKLLGIGKPKQNSIETSHEDSTTVYSNPHVSSSPSKLVTTSNSVSFSPTKAKVTATSSCDTTPFNQSGRELGHYNSLGRSAKSSRSSSSPASYLSLPRKSRTLINSTLSSVASQACPTTTVMTWATPKRPNANTAYSISPATSNPFMSLDLLSTPSLYLDEKDPINNPNPESFLKNTDPTTFGRGVSDWPLPTLLSSTTASSSTNQTNGTSSTASSQGKTLSSKERQDDNISEKSLANGRPLSSTHSLYSLSEETVPPEKCALQSRLDAKVKKVTQYEESLARESDHMKHLTMAAREKETELHEFKATIETLKNSPSGSLNTKPSCGSMSSMSSKASVSSLGSGEDGLKKRKKHWTKETGGKLRDSLKTAFGKRKSRPNLTSDVEETSANKEEEDKESETVAQLKEELLKKERKLTDIRLEALTSQHQLHQMQDAMHKMRNEINSLREENERLNKLGLSTTSLDTLSRGDDVKHASTFSLADRTSTADKRMIVTVKFPHHVIHDDMDERSSKEAILGTCHVARSINWEQLDKKVQSVFQNYCINVEPSSGLGLRGDAVISYTVGDATRHINGDAPDLLPCGYIIGNVETMTVKLRDGDSKSVDSLALELLIDRETVDRYVRLVLDHGRVMLCGPAGTGKSTLANRLAEHVVRMIPKKPSEGAIVRLDLKQRNEKEVAEYLHQLSEDCSKPESCGREIPVVLVLDNLHKSSKLKEAFLPLLNTAAHSQLPYFIGVADQNSGSGLELHQEFRWILCSNHAPPVRDFLRRSLRRSLCAKEAICDGEVEETVVDVVDWLPECWDHINRCIESHNSADVTLGPRIFLSCPMDAATSCVWFTDLWNFSIVPYVISAVKQGSKRGNANSQWSDPLDWVKESWPWSSPCDLLPIRLEDIAADSMPSDDDAIPPVTSQASSDPLLNMLLKLQEAAATNYYDRDAGHEDAFERSLDRALGDLV